jgi:small-conductance mechanosensitive channel
LVAITPSLFFLAFIIVVTVFALRAIRFFFSEIEKGRISLGGFHADWARPTFNIVRVAVLAFAFIMAFPYIPGSGSTAFKGVSIFLGLLVSLGSGSAVANAISGIILIYMRPFSLGDRVRIGETVGDVVELNVLTTRVRTPKNERVTIPNNTILGGQIVNFTARARTKELILHTTVTIGYDVPWREVHGLLIAAARATENVMAEPEPFVLQKALHDFYVEYEINAYTDKPRSMPVIYSDLHQNIQDAFDAAEVEIMSPHARMIRESRPKFAAGAPPDDQTDEPTEP